MSRLFVPNGIQITVNGGPSGEMVVSSITLSGGLYLFGPEQPRLDGTVALTAEEQAAIMVIVQAASERHWQGLATAYEGSLSAPDANDIAVPPLAGGAP